MNYLREIKTTTLHVMLRGDGIIEITPRSDWHGTEQQAQAQENYNAVISISEGRMYPVLVHLSNNRISKESRKYYASCPPAVNAVAMLVKSNFQKILGNLFIGLNKLRVETRLFTNEEEAIAWLHTKK